jgi:DNA-binding CsgD family transcriptional regulator
VFFLDGTGKVVFSNPHGRKLIGDGLDVVGKRLIGRFSPEKAALEAEIKGALGDGRVENVQNSRPLLLHRLTSEWPFAVYVLPVRAVGSQASSRFLTRTRVIILAVDSVPGGPPDPALVRDLLGLTLGEARVAALVGSGSPPRDAAVKLGITEETARTVLKRVFSKVGISRQSELTALLTKVVLR